MKEDIKNVVIFARADVGDRQARIDLRDRILSAAKAFNDASVIDAPPKSHIALISCTEETRLSLKKKFPQAAIEDEVICSLPPQQPPSPK